VASGASSTQTTSIHPPRGISKQFSAEKQETLNTHHTKYKYTNNPSIVVNKLAKPKGKEPSLAFGGQALIEGVMMRSRKYMVMCVRNPKKEIITKVENLNPLGDRYKALGVPFIRGIVMLFESFFMGMKSLFFSANTALEDPEAPAVKEPQADGKKEKTGFGTAEIAIVGVAALGVVAVFFLVPFLLANWLGLTGWVFNVVEAVVRLTMFIGYLAAISSWGEFRRVLQYHGAEHKAINAYEAGVPMDVEHVRKHSRLHPRCGTSFLFIVLIISIVLYTIMPDFGFQSLSLTAWKIGYRIALIPVIAGISYELLRLSGKYRNSPVSKVLTAPGMGFQLLTTKEPTDDMLEVSIKAVQEVTRLSAAPAQAK
jgi:uncharacterized protein YqhQ